jgi:hypothetical protein
VEDNRKEWITKEWVKAWEEEVIYPNLIKINLTITPSNLAEEDDFFSF